MTPDSSVTIRCHPSRISDVSGLGRINLERLGGRLNSVRLEPDDALLKEELVVKNLCNNFKGNVVTDLHYTLKQE
jgi:hypothetical protein